MTTRLIMAAIKNGRSQVISDHAGHSNAFSSVRGFDPTMLWLHAPGRALSPEGLVRSGESVMPPPRGGATICVVTFPPDKWAGEPGFDPEAAGSEYMARLPGLAETFDPENPGMHLTPTTDVAFVLSGNPVCEFDDGAVELSPGDVVMQQRTRHAWRNPTDEPVKVAFVLMDDPAPA